jgi:hypothetical protein
VLVSELLLLPKDFELSPDDAWRVYVRPDGSLWTPGSRPGGCLYQTELLNAQIRKEYGMSHQAKVLSDDISQRPNKDPESNDFHSEANAPVSIEKGSIIEVSDQTWAALGPFGEGKLCDPSDTDAKYVPKEPAVPEEKLPEFTEGFFSPALPADTMVVTHQGEPIEIPAPVPAERLVPEPAPVTRRSRRSSDESKE